MGRRNSTPTLKQYQSSGNGRFSAAIQDLLPKAVDQYKYCRVFYNQEYRVLKFQFIEETYEEGDFRLNALTGGLNIPITSIINHMGGRDCILNELILYQGELEDIPTIYAHCMNAEINTKRLFSETNWDKIMISIKNMNKNIIGIMHRIQSHTTVPSHVLVFSFDQFTLFVNNQHIKGVNPNITMSIDYDECLDKAVIYFNHKFKMGFPSSTKSKGQIGYSIPHDGVESLFDFYDTPIINNSFAYMEVNPHPTKEGVLVIERIFTKQACLVNSQCEDDE